MELVELYSQRWEIALEYRDKTNIMK